MCYNRENATNKWFSKMPLNISFDISGQTLRDPLEMSLDYSATPPHTGYLPAMVCSSESEGDAALFA